jgi:hypothetical protein
VKDVKFPANYFECEGGGGSSEGGGITIPFFFMDEKMPWDSKKLRNS